MSGVIVFCIALVILSMVLGVYFSPRDPRFYMPPSKKKCCCCCKKHKD